MPVRLFSLGQMDETAERGDSARVICLFPKKIRKNTEEDNQLKKARFSSSVWYGYGAMGKPVS